MPKKIQFGTLFDTGNTIEYFYDATGVKLKKVVTMENGVSIKETRYSGAFIYESNNSALSLKFISQPEGYIEPIDGNDLSQGFDYIFQYKDHLGNIRLSYKDSNNDGSVDSSEIIEENNYYPFVLEHKGYNNITSGNVNSVASKFKYNGVELEESLGLNLYEMELRLYDPTIARWNAIDPVTHHSYSTYSAFDNNPVFWADPSGADGEHYNWDKERYEDDQGNEVSFETAMASVGVNVGGDEDKNNDGSADKTPKHQFYGVSITGEIMNLSFGTDDFKYLTGYGIDPKMLYDSKIEAFHEVFKGLKKTKQIKILRKLGLPLKVAKKISANLISPGSMVASIINAQKEGFKALPLVGIMVDIMMSRVEEINRIADNAAKWDLVRDSFRKLMGSESLTDVILIYTNTNLKSQNTINTNAAKVSNSRYPDDNYNRVYFGTQYGDTLHIFGSYELKN